MILPILFYSYIEFMLKETVDNIPGVRINRQNVKQLEVC